MNLLRLYLISIACIVSLKGCYSNKLGLAKVRASNNNKKRFAVESRRHSSSDDSHMFIIKLPPNLYHYMGPKDASNQSPRNSIADTNGKMVSFNFNSNGKPRRIYHWNKPVVKKILSNNLRFSTADNSIDNLIDIKDISKWTKPWENETIEKSNGKPGIGEKKSLKRKSPNYYEASNLINKNNFYKYFPGNGQPKGFYVIKGNHKKPFYYYKNIVS